MDMRNKRVSLLRAAYATICNECTAPSSSRDSPSAGGSRVFLFRTDSVSIETRHQLGRMV